jgi:dolichol-phosphate mannosyltransferase
MTHTNIKGVPDYESREFMGKRSEYCLLIPIINEGERIAGELTRAAEHKINEICDIVICDGGSTDGSTDDEKMKYFGVNTLLVKKGTGKQGAQIRMGLWWALNRGYCGFITIDGNDKDSIEDVPCFIKQLESGYDFVQGSRFIKGGASIHMPIMRYLSVKWIHAPVISLTAKHHFTDTTNAYRAYSLKYMTDARVQPFRDVFMTYELLAYLSVRATQIGLRVCEIPVTRTYPKGKTPTKISPFKGNWLLMKILIKNFMGRYNP